MSYNVDTWKTKQLNRLRIPLASFFKHARKDWHPEKEFDQAGHLTLICCESEIKGTIENDILTVDSIKCAGEGSGTFIDWILNPALADSTGELVATCVWEGGDTINRLTVTDGKVDWEDIEL